MMRLDWNERARTNPRWFVGSDATAEEEFRLSGEQDTNFALRGLNDQWLQKANAIEIGCGEGRMTSFLALRVGRLVATDVSSAMIELARRRLAVGARVALAPMNGENLYDFATDDFDLAISYAVFQHIPKSVGYGLIAEIHRVVRPGGILRCQFARITDPEYVTPPDEDMLSLRSWTENEVRAIFLGWPAVDLETVPVTPTADDIWVTARA
jgi:SAM-dependent methyltransferase